MLLCTIRKVADRAKVSPEEVAGLVAFLARNYVHKIPRPATMVAETLSSYKPNEIKAALDFYRLVILPRERG